MACAQKAESLPVSPTSSPMHDLNHCRLESTKVIMQMGTPNISLAICVILSKPRSNSVSRTSKLFSSLSRWSSVGGTGNTPGWKPTFASILRASSGNVATYSSSCAQEGPGRRCVIQKRRRASPPRAALLAE
eukprot:658573-Prymnesium_polylepis.1